MIEALERRRARVHVHDPYIGDSSFDEVAKDADALILATNHREYYDIDPKDLAAMVSLDCVVADCWNVFDPEVFEKNGLPVITLGRG